MADWWNVRPESSGPGVWSWNPPAAKAKPAKAKAAPKERAPAKEKAAPKSTWKRDAAQPKWTERLVRETQPFVEPDWSKLPKKKPNEWSKATPLAPQWIEPDWSKIMPKKEEKKTGLTRSQQETQMTYGELDAMRAKRQKGMGGKKIEPTVGKPVPSRGEINAAKGGKKPEFEEAKGRRNLTLKEYKQLAPSQQNMVRFTSEIEANRRGSGGGDDKLREIYADLDIDRGAGGSPEVQVPHITFEQFKRGMASITEDDLFGKGKTKLAKKDRPGQRPYFNKGASSAGGIAPVGTGTVLADAPRRLRKASDLVNEPVKTPEQIAAERQEDIYGGNNRKALLNRISQAVDKRFEWLDSAQAAKDAATVAARVKAAGAKAEAPESNAQAPESPNGVQGAFNAVPEGLSKELKLTPEKEKRLLQIVSLAARESSWKTPTEAQQGLVRLLEKDGIDQQTFAQFAGNVGSNLEKNNQPLSGDPNDTLPFKDFAKMLGLSQGKG